MTTMPHLPLMQWDFKDQLPRRPRQVVNANPPPTRSRRRPTTSTTPPASACARSPSTRPADSARSASTWAASRSTASTAVRTAVTLERETLHIMDDKQRIALVETRTAGRRRLAGPTRPLPARQPPRLGQPGAGRDGRNHLLRGVLPLRQHVVSGRRHRASGPRRSGTGIRARSGMRRRGSRITGRGITRRGWGDGVVRIQWAPEL